MERLPNRYPKISQSHKVPLYKGLSLFYPKLYKNIRMTMKSPGFIRLRTTLIDFFYWLIDFICW